MANRVGGRSCDVLVIGMPGGAILNWRGLLASDDVGGFRVEGGRRMGSNMLRIGVLWLVAVLVVALPANASADKGGFTTKARQAILVDGQSGSILFSHNPDVRRPPASKSK